MMQTSNLFDRVRRNITIAYRKTKRTLLYPTFSPQQERRLIRDFHRLWYEKSLHGHTYYKGIRLIKCPFDLWISRELIFQVRPDFIIETGTYTGGPTLYYGDILDELGRGHVITVDVNAIEYYLRSPGMQNVVSRRHNRAHYLVGSSIAPEIVDEIRSMIPAGSVVMVFLDSDHKKEHVLAEMLTYYAFVTKGSYLIVEDTNVNGHPVKADFGPGPTEAVQEFLASECGSLFCPDSTCERYLLTMNPGGWLKRIK